MTCSIRTGHGTATRKNKNGNGKCRNQARPPVKYRNEREGVTTASPSSQLNKRQSGFASPRNRIKRKRVAPKSIRAIRKPVTAGVEGAGRLRKPFQNKYS